jgi:hypothetical protein
MTGSGDTLGSSFARLSRYDLILVAIPLAFLAGGVATFGLGVPVRRSMAAASLVGAFAVVDALFINPPSAAS